MKIKDASPLFVYGALAMTYTFSCPAPCSRVIRVDARDDEDAVGKIIEAGAMTCRNGRSHYPCEKIHSLMTPLPEMQLREVVQLIMQSEDSPEMESRESAQGFLLSASRHDVP
jgi:hypothetical protein